MLLNKNNREQLSMRQDSFNGAVRTPVPWIGAFGLRIVLRKN